MNKPSGQRVLPANTEAEMGLMSSLLMQPELIDEHGDLTAEHFMDHGIGAMFGLVRDLRAQSRAIDFITVTHELRERKLLDAVGGPDRVTDVFTFVPTAANIEYYAGIVRGLWVRRRIIAQATELVRAAYDSETETEELLNAAEATLASLRQWKKVDETFVSMRSAVDSALTQIEQVYKSRGKPMGLSTGFTDLDRMTGGLRGSQMIIVAARPSQGKTAMTMQMAIHMAMEKQAPGLVFSLEMGIDEIGVRTICSESPLNLQRVRDGFLSREQLPQIGSVAARLSAAPIWLDGTPALTVLDFRARARRAHKLHAIQWIVIDYLQLMRSTSRRAQESRALEVAEISMAIKAASKELNIPIIVAAQLNRDAEQRSGPPKLADLRESGQIEQDADIAMMIHRPYAKSEDQEEREQAEIHLVKQRSGPTGVVRLKFRSEFTRFENTTRELYSNNPEKRQK